MGCQDVVFLPSRANFMGHFFSNVEVVKPSGPPCHKAEVGGKSVHAPCKLLSLQHTVFLCQLSFMEIITLSQSKNKSDQPHFWHIRKTNV